MYCLRYYNSLKWLNDISLPLQLRLPTIGELFGAVFVYVHVKLCTIHSLTHVNRPAKDNFFFLFFIYTLKASNVRSVIQFAVLNGFCSFRTHQKSCQVCHSWKNKFVAISMQTLAYLHVCFSFRDSN